MDADQPTSQQLNPAALTAADAVDNHWLDCLVGCAAAASMLGVSLFRGAVPKKVKRKRKHVAYL